MELPQSLWDRVALFLFGEDLCRLASASLQLRAVSEATVQRSLDNLNGMRLHEADFSRWPIVIVCLVEPGQLRRSSALDLPKEALWHKYWTEALQQWNDIRHYK